MKPLCMGGVDGTFGSPIPDQFAWNWRIGYPGFTEASSKCGRMEQRDSFPCFPGGSAREVAVVPEVDGA